MFIGCCLALRGTHGILHEVAVEDGEAAAHGDKNLEEPGDPWLGDGQWFDGGHGGWMRMGPAQLNAMLNGKVEGVGKAGLSGQGQCGWSGGRGGGDKGGGNGRTGQAVGAQTVSHSKRA